MVRELLEAVTKTILPRPTVSTPVAPLPWGNGGKFESPLGYRRAVFHFQNLPY